jgi:hypothetical protein
VEKPVIQRVTRGTEQLELGVHGLVPRWRGVWTGATLYYVGERVRHPTDPVTYVCRSSHISANFAADLAANLWQQEFDADTIADAVSAGLIGGLLPNTPETFLRVAPGGTAIEGRTAAQVRGDLSVLSQAQLESGYARLAFANVFTQPQTLPASNPTDPNHAARKAYVDAGDRWVTLVDAAIANSAVINVTGFSLADYYLVEVHLLNVLPTANSSSNVVAQLYRNQSLVSTGYNRLRLNAYPNAAAAETATNASSCDLTASGIRTERIVSNITMSQTESNQMAMLRTMTFFQENFANVMHCQYSYCRATGGSGWVDGLRITSPVDLTANVGRLVVMGLKKS